MGFGQDGSVVLKTTDKTNTLFIPLRCLYYTTNKINETIKIAFIF